MKWSPEVIRDLQETYLNVSDGDFAKDHGVEIGGVRKQRQKLGLLKHINSGTLIVQVTEWCQDVVELASCTRRFRRRSVAYGVACNGESEYAVYRQETNRVKAEDSDTCDKTWYEIWAPEP